MVKGVNNVRLAYYKIYVAKAMKLASCSPIITSLSRVPTSLRCINRKNTVLLSFTAVVFLGMIASTLLPVLTAQALTIKTWTTNADFAKNKVSKCGETTIQSIKITGAPYNDTACAAAEADAALSLATQGVANGSTMSAGSNFTLALATDSTVWAWGQNGYNQLGDNTTTIRTYPVKVKDASGAGFLTDIVAVSVGTSSSLALKSDGTVWAWGQNTYGQIGDGTTTQRPLPVQVNDATGAGYLTDIVAVSIGIHALALKGDGTVWAWGQNNNAQLGDGTYGGKKLPTQVKDMTGTGYLNGVTSIAVGKEHSIAIKADGTLLTWGSNNYGQLGDGTTTNRPLPSQVKDTAGTGNLTNVVSVAGYNSTTALTRNGEVFTWGRNVFGTLGDGTTTNRSLPSQVKDTAGTGNLTNVSAISSNDHTLALGVDGKLSAWGYNTSRQLGDGTSTNRPLPVQTRDAAGSGSLSDILVNSDYKPTGSINGFIVDTGAGKKTRWSGIDWTTEALPATTSVKFNARTSDDGTTWTNWNSGTTQAAASTTGGADDISTLPLSRYLEIKATLATNDKSVSPTVTEFSLTSVTDVTAPDTNASNVAMSKTNGSTPITSGDWLNTPNPYFSWDAGSDAAGGTGVQGYCVYLGTDSSADVTSTKGILGTSPLDTGGACAYAVYDTHLDLSAPGVLATPLVTSSTDSYHLLVKPIDYSSLVYPSAPASYSFRYDNTAPINPAFISAPSQFVSTKDVTLSWQTSGANAASDNGSGVGGLQYKIGTNPRWFGDSHSPVESLTDILANDGNYQTNPTHDYPLLVEGNNIVSFRTIDVAGNVSATYITTVIKINTTSPTSPLNLSATPAVNANNSFAFNWQPPASFVGPSSALRYCYSVNALPTVSNCQFTAPGATGLAADAFATQPGSNIMYVVAKDEAGNINYDTHASTQFTANTPAPGIPKDFEIADVSTKASSIWKIALSWGAPASTGAGISKYAVFRSTNGTAYSQVATTGGSSYVDGSLDQISYSYKIRACDSANNCGAFSEPLTMIPTGRYTSPPELMGSVATKVSTRSADFSWMTDRISDSRVQYGTASARYVSGEVTVSASTRNHKVELLNLEAGTTYFYNVKWTDEDGNTGISSELSFTTLPAPFIKDVKVIRKTLNSALIQFTSSDAAKVDILYGKNNTFAGIKTVNTSRSESTYTVELTGLDDGTQYSFKIITYDGDSNRYDSRRLDTFETPARPKISDLRFQPVEGEPTSTQKVTWKTNVPASSTVTYGKVDATSADAFTSKLTTEHAVILKNLEDNSQYFLFVQSRDADGNLAVGDKQFFKTSLDTRPPEITNIKIETAVKGYGTDARGQVIVSWTTDEPSTSQVAYGEGISNKDYASKSAQDSYLTTEHVVVISDLGVSKVYHVQPISSDASNNESGGDDQAAIVGRASESVLSIILNALSRTFGL